MLGYLLAVLVGTGSAGLYAAAFFFPEIHRKPDFIWGGVGLFYALALWIYAKEISGGILVGQAASVALLGWFGWQTIKLRQLVPIDWQPAVPTRKKPEWTRTKAVTSIETKDPQPAVKKPTSSRAATPPIDRQSPSPAPVEPAPKSTATRRETSAPQSAPKPAPTNPPARVAANTTQATPPPATAKVSEPTIEPEEEAWIRLEVKPAPDKEVGRSTPPANPQPTPDNMRSSQQSRQPAVPPTQPPTPLPISSQPTPAVQPPPPPPVKSQPTQAPAAPAVKPEPVAEVITISFPSPTNSSTTQPSKPPSPPPATNPQPVIASPTLKPEPTAPPTAKSDRDPVSKQTSDLDKLIADLESEI
jgi:Ycf66 protein N-terminus